jgi:hypothetical protein
LKGEIYRAFNHCTKDVNRIYEYNRILDKYLANGFPEPVVRCALKNWKKRAPTTPTAPQQTQQRNMQPLDWVKIPYLPGVYEVVSRQLKKIDVRAVSSPLITLKTLVCSPCGGKGGGAGTHPLGPGNSLANLQGVVYRIPCSDCQCSHVGESGRLLAKRAQEHARDVRNSAVNNGIAQHCQRNSHCPDFTGASILFKEANYSLRIQLEGLAIAAVDQHAMNLTPPENNFKKWVKFCLDHLGIQIITRV